MSSKLTQATVAKLRGAHPAGTQRLRGYKEEDLKDMLERYGAGDFADGYGHDDQ